MKKHLFTLTAAIALVSLTLTSCGSATVKTGDPSDTALDKSKKDTGSARAQAAYVCPMGCPKGYGDKEGNCPDCQMPMEKNTHQH